MAAVSTFCEPLRSQYPDDYKAFTDDEIKRLFPEQGLLSLMKPTESDTETFRSQDGLLNTEFTDRYIKRLVDAKIIPTPPYRSDETTVPRYMYEDEALITRIKREYCFYESRYFYVVDRLITGLKDGFLSSDASKRKVVQDALDNARYLNLKLNDIIQITNRITRRRLEESQTSNLTINELNKTMDKRSQLIKAQAKILNDEHAAALLHKEMVKFTEEKNKANSNLLSLYSFLNIFALGRLIYIYRAT
jgi:hypothetical protein